jgi:hypothetical protein
MSLPSHLRVKSEAPLKRPNRSITHGPALRSSSAKGEALLKPLQRRRDYQAGCKYPSVQAEGSVKAMATRSTPATEILSPWAIPGASLKRRSIVRPQVGLVGPRVRCPASLKMIQQQCPHPVLRGTPFHVREGFVEACESRSVNPLAMPLPVSLEGGFVEAAPIRLSMLRARSSPLPQKREGLSSSQQIVIQPAIAKMFPSLKRASFKQADGSRRSSRSPSSPSFERGFVEAENREQMHSLSCHDPSLQKGLVEVGTLHAALLLTMRSTQGQSGLR